MSTSSFYAMNKIRAQVYRRIRNQVKGAGVSAWMRMRSLLHDEMQALPYYSEVEPTRADVIQYRAYAELATLFSNQIGRLSK